jgi:phage terminase large subunit-like protein
VAVGANVATASRRGVSDARVPGHAQNFSPAIIELGAAMQAGRLRHDGNPVLTWCIGNVVGKADRRGNLYPTKSRPDRKIDAAVALMMAVGRAMVEDEQAKGLEGFLSNPIFG